MLSIAASILIFTCSSNIVQTAPLIQSNFSKSNYNSFMATGTSYDGASTFNALGRRFSYAEHSGSLNLIGDTQLTKQEKEEILRYLFKYGYIGYVKRGHDEGVFVSDNSIDQEHLLQDALSLLVGMFDVKSEPSERKPYDSNEGLTVSLSDILEYSRRPRCSNSDFPYDRMNRSVNLKTTNSTRTPYFSVESPEHYRGSKYINHSQTWRLMSTSDSIEYNMVRKVLHRAFLTWAKYTPLNFVELTSTEHGPVHHEIYFVKRRHYINSWLRFECGISSADNEDDTAHGYFPLYGGTLHINTNKMWSDHYSGKLGQLNLWQTATHEIGHTLGLDHLPVQMSKQGLRLPQIMHPHYHEYIADGTLGDNDVMAIQRLYGRYPDGKKPYQAEEDDRSDDEYLFLPIPNGHSLAKENTSYVLSSGFSGNKEGRTTNKEGRITGPDVSKLKLNYDVPSDLSGWLDALDKVNPK